MKTGSSADVCFTSREQIIFDPSAVGASLLSCDLVWPPEQPHHHHPPPPPPPSLCGLVLVQGPD